VLFNTVQSVWFPLPTSIRTMYCYVQYFSRWSEPAYRCFYFLPNILYLFLLLFSTLTQLSKYLCEVEDDSLTTSATSNTLDFWIQREHVYDKLSLVAEDILAAPASQAYVERVFSVCGLLTAGRRNRMSKSLQMRACLKLNRRVLASTDFNTTAWKYKTCSCVIM